MGRQSSMQVVFTIIDYGENRSRWVRIGAAFTNQDGSLNVLLDAVPVNGKLHIRKQDEGESETEGDEIPF